MTLRYLIIDDKTSSVNYSNFTYIYMDEASSWQNNTFVRLGVSHL